MSIEEGKGRIRRVTVQRMEQMASQLRDDDPTGFAAIVGQHQSMVFSLAYHFLRNRAQAEDIAQEVFLSLYRNLAAIESPEHLRFWLRKAACRRCLDCARRQKLRRFLRLEDVPEPVIAAPVPDPMLRQMLLRLVASLPEKQRMILVLRYQEDLDPAEIARVLDIPLNTVKSYLQRSLNALRDKVKRCIDKVG
ncbi:MAG TPA: sigma-70 family RNA polymerase sigma factor [Acidobacteriota bacterium]